MSILKGITASGVVFAETKAEKRNLVLTNYISIVAACSMIAMLAGRALFAHVNWPITFTLLLGAVLFFFPIALNRYGFIHLSRLTLCWVPPLFQMYATVRAMHEVSSHETSLYVGLRFFILAFTCFPFLVFDLKKAGLFMAGFAGPFLFLLLFDPILNFFDVGYHQMGLPDASYDFTNVRSIISALIIGCSLVFLKRFIEKNESLNEELIEELAVKNRLLQEQAEHELNSLNNQLKSNLKELHEREFILSESQRIAKIGSWKFKKEGGVTFWSEEMYNIFGLDKNVDLNVPNLQELLWGEHHELLNSATAHLLEHGTAYDYTMRTKTPLGHTKWVRVYAHPIEENGEITGAGGICHDVTFYKEAEDLARKNERNYRSLFEQATDSITMVDFKGNFIDVNTSFCQLLGYSREELLLMNIADVIDPEQLKVNPIRFDLLAGGEHLTNERRMVRKDGSYVLIEANVKIFGEGIIMAIARDITGRKAVETEKEKARHSLNERVKELTTLYKCGQALQREARPIHETLQEIVSILPPGWQFPDITAAKISLGGMEFVTPNYRPSPYRQFSEFKTRNELQGSIEVVYLEECPEEAEGPFLAEERNLLTMITDMIRLYLIRRYETEALKRTEANQSATINNTNFLIWSVNRDFELISFNKPFTEFVRDKYGLHAKLGSTLTENAPHVQHKRDEWSGRYVRALAGEMFKVSYEIGEQQYEFSLNPIIEDGKTIGVSVFGEDVSERMQHQKQMLAVNKQIGELRLMALRSVMNPHFIFNCLNSIQYYILENDQKNAVIYLSTFSKLIRS
ncbi:MAG TPA: PAS domain S-box protein, partial [Cyclobacteriaceae bacterium]